MHTNSDDNNSRIIEEVQISIYKPIQYFKCILHYTIISL